MKDLLIVINSSNRPESQITLDNLSTSKVDVVLAIPSKQVNEYEYNNPGIDLWLIPNVWDDLPSQRQYCMINHHLIQMEEHRLGCKGNNNNYKYIFFMDDDLTFLKRNKKYKLERANKTDVFKMIKLVYKHLTKNNIPIVGVSTRLGNNRVLDDHVDITRVTRCYAVSVKAFKEVGAVFNPIQKFVMEDFHMNLCFLEKGYKDRVIYTYAQEDKGSNTEGGCSVYRTAKVQKKTAMWMHINHPGLVKLKVKKGWKGMGESRLDCIIQWKKSYKPRRKKTGSMKGFLKKSK